MSNTLELQVARETLKELDNDVEQALEAWLQEDHDEAKAWDAYAWALGVYKLQLNTIEELEKT